jgi:hypothetical protein
MSPRRFAARFPGSCLCGARFDVGAMIFWDASVRRATPCPSCVAPRAIMDKWQPLPNSRGIVYAFGRHPKTGEIAVCAFADPTSIRAVETCSLRDGHWQWTGCGGEPVFARGCPSHEAIEALRMAVA